MASYASLLVLGVSRRSQGRVFASLLTGSREGRDLRPTGGVGELTDALGCSRILPNRAWNG